MADNQYKVALCMMEGAGAKTIKKLISYCGSPEAVFREKRKNLIKIPGIGPVAVRAITGFKEWDQVEKECLFIEENSVLVHLYSDASYSHRLLQCDDGPAVMFTQGNIDLNPQRALSVVGTRKATQRGVEVTRNIIEGLKDEGITVVSGLAYGVDVCAHRACMKHGMSTWGVLAHGLDSLYPSPHRETSKKMLALGGLVTEFPTGTQPIAENFPRRNRIVAGLSDATLVVESEGRGGSLITADLAFHYGREVFAIPGRVHDRFSKGCNRLIQQNKAGLILDVKDLLREMGWEKGQSSAVQTVLFQDFTVDEERVMELLRKGGKQAIDALGYQLEMSSHKISALLLELEFKGAVLVMAGKMYEANC